MSDFQPVLVVSALWVLFGGTHVALAAVRDRLVARFGLMPYTRLYFVVASLSFTALVVFYARHRFEGPAGLALSQLAPARLALQALAVAGIVLLVLGLQAYPRLPTALFLQKLREPRGVERITRHPTFAGFALFATAHALLASRLVGTVWFAGFVVLTAVGAWHQDRRALAVRGEPYAGYLRATSFVPFARGFPAISDLPLGPIVLGVGVALVLRAVHGHLLDFDGAYVAAAVVIGGSIAGIQAFKRARRSRAS